MPLIRDLSDSIHIIRDYSVPHTTIREDALRWIARAAQCQEIKVNHIEIENSNPARNTQVGSLDQIGGEESFVAQYQVSSSVCVSIAGEYGSRPFLLSVSLESGDVGLICWGNSSSDAKVLEQIFALA